MASTTNDQWQQTGRSKRKEPSAFSPQDGWQLVSQGAEARLWKVPGRPDHNEGKPCIAKERFRKKYRHPVLDERLTKQRCRMEGRLLEKCLKGGIAVPRVLRVEAPVLYIEYIDGTTVRNLLQTWIETSDSKTYDAMFSTKMKEKVDCIGRIMGAVIGQLHGRGIVHGDLTTSNMMVRGNDLQLNDETPQTILLIDFGLAKNSESAEERAVDLYVLQRAISSTHPSLPESFMDETILQSYARVAPKSDAVLQRLDQVRLRGRKRECFG